MSKQNNKTYRIKEIHLTLQGEGFYTGRVIILCRFEGCNLACDFCDTDFTGTDGQHGGVYSLQNLTDQIINLWPGGGDPIVAFTGGEPLLQLDELLVSSLKGRGYFVAVETNGTQPAPESVDWVTVSPKTQGTLVLKKGSELKLVVPQEGVDPENYLNLDFEHFFLQPKDGPNRESYMKETIEYCLVNPRWRLSFQAHKLLNIP
jgi:7-carboxy-7-deazaguanine synthase